MKKIPFSDNKPYHSGKNCCCGGHTAHDKKSNVKCSSTKKRLDMRKERQFLDNVYERYSVMSAKQVGKLYLFISPDNLSLAVKSGTMKPLGSTQPMEMKKKYKHHHDDTMGHVFLGVSTTRNPHWRPNLKEGGHGYWNVIRLTLDGDKISNKYPIKPYNDFWKWDDYAKKKRSDDEFYSQSENKIITDRGGFKGWLKYLLAIDVLNEAKDEFESLKLDTYLKNIPINYVEKF